MRFRAIKLGIFDATRMRPGQEFRAPDDFKASWAEPIEPEPSVPKASKKKASRKKTAKKKA